MVVVISLRKFFFESAFSRASTLISLCIGFAIAWQYSEKFDLIFYRQSAYLAYEDGGAHIVRRIGDDESNWCNNRAPSILGSGTILCNASDLTESQMENLRQTLFFKVTISKVTYALGLASILFALGVSAATVFCILIGARRVFFWVRYGK